MVWFDMMIVAWLPMVTISSTRIKQRESVAAEKIICLESSDGNKGTTGVAPRGRGSGTCYWGP